jgi:hypothetical protein
MKVILMLTLALIFTSCAHKGKWEPTGERTICHTSALSDRLICEHQKFIPEASVEL